MGRAPCCDKANVKRGPWSPEEDAKLKSYIEQHGTGGNWIALPQKIGLKRCGKSCRLRWLNYLRPNIKHGGFSEEEDNIICSLYVSIGSRWSVIAAQLPGRTDNDIKNYWNTRLKKKLLGKQHRKEQQARRGSKTTTATTSTGSLSLKQQQANYKSTGNTEGDGDDSSLLPQNTIAHPYMPVLPPLALSYSMSQPPSPSSCFNLNHQAADSIRNLLVKLGGRFDDDHHHIHHPTTHHHQDGFNFQFPDGATSSPSPSPSTLQLPLYDEEQVNMVSSASAPAASMNNIALIHNNQLPQFTQTHYSGLNLVQAAASFTQPLLGQDMFLSNFPPTQEGLEFLYEQHMIHDNVVVPTTSCDTNALAYSPPLPASNYDCLPHHFAFQHS